MVIRQLSVFVGNKAGTLAEITSVLADKSINLRALSLADTKDYGILRLIVDDPDNALAVLKNAGFTASITEVLAVLIDDRPGGLSKALQILAGNGYGIEYMYAFISKRSNEAVVVMKIGDEKARNAAEILTSNGYKVLCGKDVY